MEELIQKAIADERHPNTIEKLFFLDHVMNQMLCLESILETSDDGPRKE